MKILAITAALFAIGVAHVYLKKNISTDFGSNIGRNHMKEQWGIEEENKW